MSDSSAAQGKLAVWLVVVIRIVAAINFILFKKNFFVALWNLLVAELPPPLDPPLKMEYFWMQVKKVGK